MTGTGGQERGQEPDIPLSRVHFTNLKKILYPVTGITKQQVIEYYIRIAPKILPFLNNRPLTMHRYPDGVGNLSFMRKMPRKAHPGMLRYFHISR